MTLELEYMVFPANDKVVTSVLVISQSFLMGQVSPVTVLGMYKTGIKSWNLGWYTKHSLIPNTYK